MELAQDILARTQELFMRVGIRSVSMDDIARELGRSKKTLYQFFLNKEQLVTQIMERHIELEQRLLSAIREESLNAMDEWYRIFDHNCKFLSSMNPSVIFDLRKYHPDAWGLFDQYKHEVIRKIVGENMIRGKVEGLYRDDLDENILSWIYVYRLEMFADGSLFPSSERSRAEVLKEFVVYHLRGIASPKGINYLEKKLKF
jgi:AcrR family transcriptional regulator